MTVANEMSRREAAGKVTAVSALFGAALWCPTLLGQQQNSLDKALGLVRAARYSEATEVLLSEQARAPSAVGHYLLAVCYSNLGDPAKAFSHAIESLSARPPLDPTLVGGAKALITWAAVETARPVVRAHFELSVETRSGDLASQTAQEAARKKQDDLIERMTIRAQPYVDIQNDLLLSSASISCVEPECRRALLAPPPPPPKPPLPQ